MANYNKYTPDNTPRETAPVNGMHKQMTQSDLLAEQRAMNQAGHKAQSGYIDPNLANNMGSHVIGQEIAESKADIKKAKETFEMCVEKISGVVATHIHNTHPNNPQPQPIPRSDIGHQMQQNVDLVNAVMTERIENPIPTMVGGMQVGRYTVMPSQNARGKNRFTVSDTATKATILENIHIIDTAQAIVKLLNAGYSRHSPEIQSYESREEQYQKYYFEACAYARKRQTNEATDIAETLLEESKNKAVMIREEIKSLNATLR